jgi:DNA-binding Lrp family transcriptional regulator
MAEELTDLDRRLLAELEQGLPIEPQPYASLARRLGVSEAQVLERLAALQVAGTVSRFGVVVRHRELGYHANAMVVWDVPDDHVERAGRDLAELPFVTLCYRRPRRLPRWPYNLFCMIHGKCREEVLTQIEQATCAAGLENRSSDVLFSGRRFKQRGARYRAGSEGTEEREFA